MGGRGLHATAFIGLLMLLQVVAMDRQAPCATPDSARDLEARREAALAEEGRCHYHTCTAADRGRTSFSGFDLNITLYVGCQGVCSEWLEGC